LRSLVGFCRCKCDRLCRKDLCDWYFFGFSCDRLSFFFCKGDRCFRNNLAIGAFLDLVAISFKFNSDHFFSCDRFCRKNVDDRYFLDLVAIASDFNSDRDFGI
jgi:hypothetical protein